MYKKMCDRVLTTVILVVAVVLSVIMARADNNLYGSHDKFITLIIKPFIVMTIVLATGALIKYLIFGNTSCCGDCSSSHKDQSCSTKKKNSCQ